MKNYLLCLALSLAFAQAAAAQDRSGGYMGFSVGSFSFAEDEDLLDDSATAYRVMGGYRFNDHFAVEGGWEKTGDVEESFSEVIPPFGTVTLNIGADFEILTVKALGFIPFEKVSLLGGVGYFDADANISASATALQRRRCDAGRRPRVQSRARRYPRGARVVRRRRRGSLGHQRRSALSLLALF